MDTDTQDPTEAKAARIGLLKAVAEILIPLAGIGDLKTFDAAAQDLLKFLDEEHQRYSTEPNAVPSNKWYREQVHVSEGELECDDGAVVSRGGDPGAYVQTWTWVAAPTCTIHPEIVLAGSEENTPCPQCAFESREDGWGE